jgi:anthranilate synthase component 1
VTLPIGTVSGAPKVRALQLIHEMEANRRGPYSGGIGYVSFTGDMGIASALRTMVFQNSAGFSGSSNKWLVHMQSGAAVVAESEHQECINKAAALSTAIDLSDANFVGR